MKKILSICIASYNNGSDLYKTIRSILKYKNDDIEVVVIDNCSTDNTKDLLTTILDDRFVFVSNARNYGAIINYMMALSNGTSKYVMFLADKDTININYIQKVIDILKNINFCFGFFDLNYKSKYIKIKKYHTVYDCLKNFAYLSKHPTGYIYNRGYLLPLNIIKNYISYDKVGVFPFEFICADLSVYKSAVKFYIPFLNTYQVLSDSTKKSQSYSEQKENLYFTPAERIKIFNKYSKHLYELNINDDIKNKIFRKLINDLYQEALIVYKQNVENKDICRHYKMTTLYLSNIELLNIKKNIHTNIVNLKYYNNDKYINTIYLSFINLKYYIKIIFYPLIQFIKKCKKK